MSAMGMSQSDAGFVNDAVIGATGARPAALPISGFDLSINAKEVFDGKETSEKVVIICLDNSNLISSRMSKSSLIQNTMYHNLNLTLVQYIP